MARSTWTMLVASLLLTFGAPEASAGETGECRIDVASPTAPRVSGGCTDELESLISTVRRQACIASELCAQAGPGGDGEPAVTACGPQSQVRTAASRCNTIRLDGVTALLGGSTDEGTCDPFCLTGDTNDNECPASLFCEGDDGGSCRSFCVDDQIDAFVCAQDATARAAECGYDGRRKCRPSCMDAYVDAQVCSQETLARAAECGYDGRRKCRPSCHVAEA